MVGLSRWQTDLQVESLQFLSNHKMLMSELQCETSEQRAGLALQAPKLMGCHNSLQRIHRQQTGACCVDLSELRQVLCITATKDEI